MALREQARLHVAAVLAQPDDAYAAAREAKARDFERRVEQALSTVDVLRETTDAADNARASTTEPDARVMKMADGGFRPAYNVQLAVAGDVLGGGRAIVGLRVTNSGSDAGSITPMLDDVRERTGTAPKTLLADANHATLSCIEAAGARGVDVIAPTMKKRGANGRRRLHRDGPTTKDAKQLYKRRASLVELTHAHLKERFGLRRMPVRGRARVLSTTLLYALAMNVVHNAAALLS